MNNLLDLSKNRVSFHSLRRQSGRLGRASQSKRTRRRRNCPPPIADNSILKLDLNIYLNINMNVLNVFTWLQSRRIPRLIVPRLHTRIRRQRQCESLPWIQE